MEAKQMDFLKTGTTTVAILCKESAVLAADRRATAGSLIADKNANKVFPISDNMAVTIAGSVSDIQVLIRYLKAEVKLKDLRTGRRSTTKEVANLLSGMTYTTIRRMGGVCHFILAGHDTNGVSMYEIYPDGSIMNITEEVGFVSSGSGSVIAYGLLEDAWKKDMTTEQGSDLAVRAINSALQRDSMSGQGIDVFVVDKKGARQLAKKTVNTRAQ